MVFAQGGLFFLAPQSPRSYPTPTWCSHRSNDQIMSILFFHCLLFSICLLSGDLYSFLRMCFHLLILGSLYMLKIILTILKKIFWNIKGETTLVCLPVKPSHSPFPENCGHFKIVMLFLCLFYKSQYLSF